MNMNALGEWLYLRYLYMAQKSERCPYVIKGGSSVVLSFSQSFHLHKEDKRNE